MLKNQIWVMILVLSLLTTGCASHGNVVDRNMTLIQGTSLGLLIGGGIGATVGALTSDGNKEKTLKAAGIGAGVGAVLGGMYANYIVKEKERIYAENKSIDALKADIDAHNAAIEEEIALTNKEVATLSFVLKKMTLNKEDIQKHKKQVEQVINNIEMKIEQLDASILTTAIELNKYKDFEDEEISLKEYAFSNPEAQLRYNKLIQNANALEKTRKELEIIQKEI